MAFNVFIRGIYSTSLTKIFKDAGYNIVFPSPTIVNRFPDLKTFEEGNYSKDIVINDRYDREGISITVKKDVWEKIKNDFPINQNRFPNLIQLISRFPLNSIHKGIVVQSNRLKNNSKVRLIPEQNDLETDISQNFSTTLGRVNRSLKVGTEDVFQVVFEDVGRNYAYLNRGYTVSGDLAVIMPYNKRGFISKKIRDKEQRTKLNNVIEKVTTSEFGILLRTAAQYASELEILREIQKLREKYIEIESIINQSSNKIGPIDSEYFSINFLFPSTQKLKFDEIRSSVSPTLALHHDIKAGINTNNKLQLKVLNLIEGIMTEANTLGFSDKINKQFTSFYHSNLYVPKQFLNITHYKLNGRSINLKPGVIKKIERNHVEKDKLKIILRRNLTGHGIYDGLDIPIEFGDFAIGIYEVGNMYYENIYYSQDYELKGRYFNINTPILLRSDGIHYFDLEIDVIEPLNKTRTIIDNEILDKALQLNIISQELYDKALDVAEKIKSGEILSELDKSSSKARRKISLNKAPESNSDKVEDSEEDDEKSIEN